MISVVKYLNEMFEMDDLSPEEKRRWDKIMRKTAKELPVNKQKAAKKVIKKSLPLDNERQEPGTFTKPLKKMIDTTIENR